jgi:hypothetical protein
VSFETNIAGGRVAAGADEPFQWPLLARLPRAGRAPVAVQRPAAPKMRHGETAPTAANPALAVLNQRPPASQRAPHAAAMSPHVVPEAYDWPDLDDSARAAERLPAPRREYLRIDAPDQRLGRVANRRTADQSLAARAYRWHSALAPHAGVAMTVALILSATLLYWLTLGQGSAGGDFEDILDKQNTWSSEAPLEPKIAVDQPAPGEVKPRFDVAAQPPHAAPVAAAQTPASVEGSTIEDESAAITPTPRSEPYPVTEYVSMDFGLLGAVEQAAAAEPAVAAAATKDAAVAPAGAAN